MCSSLPRTDVHEVIRQWRRVIEAFRSGASETFADKVDWLAKRRLFDMLRNRAGSRLSVSKLEQLDMDYHDVANGALYASLCRRGAMRTLVNESQAHEPSMFLPTIPAPHCVDGSSSRHDRTTRNIPVIGRDYR